MHDKKGMLTMRKIYRKERQDRHKYTLRLSEQQHCSESEIRGPVDDTRGLETCCPYEYCNDL